MNDRDRGACCELGDAADVARGNQIGTDTFDMPDLARAQPIRDVRLQNVVSAGRAAAQMAFRNLLHDKTHL